MNCDIKRVYAFVLQSKSKRRALKASNDTLFHRDNVFWQSESRFAPLLLFLLAFAFIKEEKNPQKKKVSFGYIYPFLP